MSKSLQEAVLDVMKDVEYIKKDGTNAQQGYKFTSAEDCRRGQGSSYQARGFDLYRVQRSHRP
jgi:hypothetical protein